MLQIKLNTSTDISSSVKWDALSWVSVLTKEVDRLDFTILKTPSKTVPIIGDTIELFEDGIKLYGGIVVEKMEKIFGGLLIGYELKCKDWSAKLDGKLVVKNYAAPSGGAATYSPSQICKDIINLFVSASLGFTTNNVKTATFNIASIKFNYEQVSRAITQLADQIGWDWYVDPDKDIHFFDEETAVAPFNLDDTTGNYEWATLEINQNIVNLKNYIFVRGSEYKKTIAEANAVDVYQTNGTQATFPLAYKYDNITVKLAGTVQTIGTDQQSDPSSVQILYNFNEKFIKFTTTPGSGQTVKIYGDAYIPIIAAVRDQISIATYGEFQQAVIDKGITSVYEAQSRAKAELNKYAATVNEGRFKTTQKGLRVGQQITVSSAIRGIAAKTFKINRINGKARGSDHMEYEAFLLASGEITFTDIMVGLLSKDLQNVVIASNEVLQRLDFFDESIALVEAITNYKRTPPYTWGIGGSNDLVSPRGWDFGTWQ